MWRNDKYTVNGQHQHVVYVFRPVRIAMCDGSSSEVLVGVVSTGVGSRSVAAAVDKRLTAATPVDCG